MVILVRTSNTESDGFIDQTHQYYSYQVYQGKAICPFTYQEFAVPGPPSTGLYSHVIVRPGNLKTSKAARTAAFLRWPQPSD
jgi:hypothetical protein